jgi:PAS domain S-box-containing protein
MADMTTSVEQCDDQRQILEFVALGKPLCETLEAITKFVERHEPGSRCAILLLSPDRQQFTTCVAPSFPASFCNALSEICIHPPCLGSFSAAADRGELIVISDIANDDRYPASWRNLLLTCGSRALSSHPISDGEMAVACLSIHYSEPQSDLPRNVPLIGAATHLASLAIHRETAKEADERRSRRASLLSSIAQRLVVHDDPTPDLEPAFNAVCAEIEADLYFNYAVDAADPERLSLQFCQGLTEAQKAQFSEFRFGEYICGEVAATQQTIILGDLDKDTNERTRGVRELGGRCYAGVPLMAGGRLHGIVAFVSRSKRAFTAESVALVQSVATQFAAAIDRSALLHAKMLGEQRLTLVADAMPSLMAMVDGDMRYEYVNAAYEHWFKMPAEQVVGRKVASVLGEKAFATIREKMERALLGERVRFETDIIYDTAGFRHIRAEYIPRPEGNGRTRGCYVLVHDLTERQQQEVVLARNERALAELIQKAPFGVYIVDSELRIVQMNAQSQTGAFKNVQPILGRDLDAAMRVLWPEAVAEKVINQFRHTLETGEPFRSRDFIERRSDVSTVEAYEWELHRILLLDGRFGVVCYFFDSTPIRRAESLARESEHRFRHMADNAPVMIWMTEVDGTCSYLSKPWYDFTGQTLSEGLGMGWLEAIHPEDRIAAKQTFTAAHEQQVRFRLEYRLRRHDGIYLWCIDAAAPRFDTDGCYLGYIGSVIDISDRKQAEDTQTLLLSELNHRVKNTLANVQAIAQQTLRHTRNPERFVESFSGRLQSLSKAHSMLSHATWQGTDLEALIRDQLSMGPVDIRSVEIEGPAITLAPQMSLHLALVIHELGTNSIKYGALSSNSGRVRITWTTDGSEMKLRWAERNGPRVTTLGARSFGTTLIEQSAKSEGGEAIMDLEDGGVVWRFRLPLHRVTKQFHPTTPALLRTPQGELVQSLRGLRVLVIEDEPLVAMELAAIIQDAGAEAAGPVSSCEAALQKVSAGGFDLAILDGNLLGEPVDDIAAALTRAKVPFLFISGYGRESLPRAYALAPLVGKPFASKTLVDELVKLTAVPTTLSVVDVPS